MAANREAYQHYMEQGYNAAWDGDWSTAIKAYSQAIHELPEDPEAHIQLGLALLNAQRLDDALKVFTRGHQLAPDDPVPLERSADALERLGRLKDAAQQYIHVADIYLSVPDLNKAISNWQRATQLTPGHVSIHAKLAQAFERIGDKKKAVYQYLVLAYNFQRVEDTDKAIRALERALRLDARNSQVLNALSAVQAGQLPTPPEPEGDENQSIFPTDAPLKTAKPDVGDADPLGPMGEAMGQALGILAAYVFDNNALDAGGSDALQAMEMQQQDSYAGAIEAYKRAEGRLRHPALKLNLGVLLLLEDRPEEATKHLGEATLDPVLSAGALHALGQANFRIGKHKQAARYLVQSLQAVDTSLAMNEAETGELAEIYSMVLSALDNSSEITLAEVNERFIELLSGKDWKQRIPDIRQFLREIMRDNDPDLPGGIKEYDPEIVAALGRIDNYIRRGLLVLAMDDAHRAVELRPLHLPVHVRMAEIMMREGRLRQAITKYNTIARAYMARDENDRAASILSEVLEMAPLDVSVRLSLIELLENEERMDEMLDQYVDLARTYNQLGNFDLSRETFQQAERLAKRIDAGADKLVKIKHNLADMEQMRLDTNRAIKTYEEITELAADDERAYRMLVELNYSRGNQVEAIKNLDKLLGVYARKKQISKIVQLLEELVKQYPADMNLRSRLADMYRKLDRREKAIEQLDVLGELQLEAGMHDAARGTIQAIISLKPDHVEDYQRLLTQLGG
jgi:tetratricopeptide (TPR) repeat protein